MQVEGTPHGSATRAADPFRPTLLTLNVSETS